jgi:hypothetical protein
MHNGCLTLSMSLMSEITLVALATRGIVVPTGEHDTRFGYLQRLDSNRY